MSHPALAPVAAPTTPTTGRTASPLATRHSPLATAILVLFLADAVARLVAIPADLSWLARGSTFLLMPSLAAWVLARRGPVLVVVALVCSAAGDILLGYEDLFLAGMGAFAVAHICYVVSFVRSGARPHWYVVAGYAVALVGLVVWLWPGLGDLRIPVAAYALLLTATAVTSCGLGWWTGLGGALFFVSDALIAAVDLAGALEPPMPGMWVMTTYIAAQLPLASGILRRAAKVSDSRL